MYCIFDKNNNLISLGCSTEEMSIDFAETFLLLSKEEYIVKEVATKEYVEFLIKKIENIQEQFQYIEEKNF